jgi:hypothetical protein
MHEEVHTLACPSLNDERLRTPHRLPSREQIGGNSDDRECMRAEREAVHVVTHHVPEAHDSARATHADLLAQALKRVETLALPAFVVTHDWAVPAANPSFRYVVGLPPLEVSLGYAEEPAIETRLRE